MDKRTLLAVVLSLAVLFAYQTFFVKPPVKTQPAPTQQEQTVASQTAAKPAAATAEQTAKLRQGIAEAQDLSPAVRALDTKDAQRFCPVLKPEAAAAAMRQTVPAGRFARPEEVAAAIAFLCAPAAGYINGVSLAVDGGRMQSI